MAEAGFALVCRVADACPEAISVQAQGRGVGDTLLDRLGRAGVGLVDRDDHAACAEVRAAAWVVEFEFDRLHPFAGDAVLEQPERERPGGRIAVAPGEGAGDGFVVGPRCGGAARGPHKGGDRAVAAAGANHAQCDLAV